MLTFQDRKQQIMEICALDNQPRLLNIYGEAGIGKSSLLQEASVRIREAYSSCLVLLFDLADLSRVASADRPRHLVLELMKHAGGWLRDITPLWTNVDATISQIITQLIDLSTHVPVFLVYDTTEKVQDDRGFWQWMETELVGPLAVEGQVRQIFAGRFPISWRGFEIRRIVVHLPLHPLSTEKASAEETDQAESGAAVRLVSEALIQHSPELGFEDADAVSNLVALILSLSFGHPRLSLKLAEYVARLWPAIGDPRDLRAKLSTDVVREFIERDLFEGIEQPWIEILWWVSVLDWFDTTLLQLYLSLSAPELVKNKPEYFFIQGISSLRRHHTVLWREAQGDQLYGSIAPIARLCMEISYPESYRKACLAASKTFAQLSQEFEEGSPEKAQYKLAAEVYLKRLEEEASR